ncbi:hypothetical protein [Spiroplasma endosymbiont of Dactylopius coccus]
MAFFALIISLINVPQIIANILLIKGKLNSSILPGVLTMLGLGIVIIGIFCGVAFLLENLKTKLKNHKMKTSFIVTLTFRVENQKQLMKLLLMLKLNQKLLTMMN